MNTKKKIHQKIFCIFFLIYISVPVFNIFGFVAVPDVPLLFFSIIYLHIFIKFSEKTTFKNGLLLGFSASLLLYSKYHGFLVIFSSLLSNYKLLKNKYLWVAGIFSALLYFPHIFWQINNDFPSFKYHLIERNNNFRIKDIYEYILNTILILNPFLVFLFIFKNKNTSADFSSKRLFTTLFLVFIIFFGLSAVRGHVEPHWISVSAISFVILLFYNVLHKNINRKYVIFFSFISVFFIITARLILLFNIFPHKTGFSNEKKMLFIKNKAKGLPVIFKDSYSGASLFEFYTGEKTFSSNSVWYRKNQYNLWNIEENFNNKKVFVVSNGNLNHTNFSVFPAGDTVFYNITENYITAEKLEISTEPVISELKNNKICMFNLIVKNPYPYAITLNKNTEFVFVIYSETKYIGTFHIDTKLPEFIKQKSKIILKSGIQVKDIPTGYYHYYISLIQKNFPPLFNGNRLKLKISE